ncbi:hypothetical protein RIF25_04985 [Thermosynechococcaceae cyanobacterium BACA0444]|uniref:Uncharacterized protein n=1 Tax=Pseudocalidococcus azoricus BACA0444 TaxID=2918990 RepID=A0AAE4FSI5_9CYAN|nr:hypothetical protein [Pseudocalidococcus azoricus]MDS3860155.1 hypothetical protein [Pseudocalidococcus azoricus BACA0444]
MNKLISLQQTQAATLLAQGQSNAAVAREIGCDRSTIIRWKKDPDFMAVVDAELQALQKDCKRVLRSYALDAANRLGELISEDECPYHVQLAASKEVLDRVKGMEPQAPTQGVDPQRYQALLNEYSELAEQLFLSKWENIGHHFVQLGFVESIQEYMAWSEAQKAIYAIILDIEKQRLEGAESTAVDPDLAAWYQEARIKETPEFTLAWMEAERDRWYEKLVTKMTLDVDFEQVEE